MNLHMAVHYLIWIKWIHYLKQPHVFGCVLIYFDSLLNREPKAACSICLLGNCMYLFCESYYLRKASILWLTKELYNTASLGTSRPGSSQPLPAASHKIPIAWTPRCVRSYQSGRGSAAAYSPVPKNTSPGSRWLAVIQIPRSPTADNRIRDWGLHGHVIGD